MSKPIRSRVPYVVALLLVPLSCEGPPPDPTSNRSATVVTFDPSTHGGSANDTVSVGSLVGSHTVDGRGHFNYTVPLQLPPARRGVGPELELTYNSGAGNGIFGMGFSLVGLSEITRCPGGSALPGTGFDELVPGSGVADTYCLDGDRMVRVDGEGWFTTETDPTVRIERAVAPDKPPLDGFPPSTKACGYVVYSQDGTIRRYGCTSDSTESLPDDPSPLKYALSKVWDRSSNYYDVEYLEISGRIIGPKQIRYTGNSKTETEPTRRITFEYTRDDDPRPDPLYDREQEDLVILKRVTKIVIEAESYNDKTWEYLLTYSNAGSTGRSRIEKIRYCSEDHCLPDTRFDWQIGQNGFGGAYPTAAVAPVLHSPCMAPKVGDFDGDGLDDILSSGADCGELRLAKGDPDVGLVAHEFSSFVGDLSQVPALPNAPPLLIDLNADDAADYLRIRDDARAYRVDFVKQQPPTYASSYEKDPYGIEILHAVVADMDGDGLSDLLGCERVPGGCNDPGCGEWNFYRNRGDGTLADPIHGTSDGPGRHRCGTGRLQTFYPSGDGRVWLFSEGTFWPDSNSSHIDAVLYVDPGATQLTVESTARDASLYGPRVHLDAWGDGRLDLLQYWSTYPQHQRIVRWGTEAVAPDTDDLLVGDFSLLNNVVGRYVVLDENLDGVDDLLYPNFTIDNAGPEGTDLGGWDVIRLRGGMPDDPDTLGMVSWGESPSCAQMSIDVAMTSPTYPGRVWETGLTLRTISPYVEENYVDWLNGIPFQALQNCSVDGIDQPVCNGECLARSQPVATGDFNGDGLADFATSSTPGVWIVYPHKPALYDGNPAAGGADLIRHITDGFGGTMEITYATMKDKTVYERGEDCGPDVECVLDGRTLTASVQRTDNVVESFFYRDARRVRANGRYLGFAEIERNTELSNASFRRIVRFDNSLESVSVPWSLISRQSPFAGQPQEELMFVNDAGRVRVERTTWDYRLYPGRSTTSHFIVPQTTTREAFSFGLVGAPPTYPAESSLYDSRRTGTYVTTIVDFDEYGLVHDRIESATSHTGEVEETRIETDFEANEEKWLFGPRLIEVTRTTASRETAERTYEVEYSTAVGCDDCLGSSGTIDIYPGSYIPRPFDRLEIDNIVIAEGIEDRENTVAFGYDDFGNVTSMTKSAPGLDSRTTTFEYETDEHMFVSALTNAEGHIETSVWDPILGRPRAVTTPFGTRTESTYDLFGRGLERTYFANDDTQLDLVTTTEFVRLSGGAMTDPSLLRIRTETPSFGSTTTDFDDLGRPMRSEWLTDNGPVQQYYEYDELGRVRRTSLPTPTTEAPHGGLWARWDIYGRPIVRGVVDADVDWIEEPTDDELTLTEYQFLWDFGENLFRNTTTDASGKVFHTFSDHLGRTVRSVDGDGTAMCFGYAPFGGVDRIERGCETGAPAQVSSFTIDDWGRTVISDDPDGAGTRAYLYNGFGELRRTVDGLGRETTFVYDDIGRVESYTNDDGQATFTYDAIASSPAGGDLTAPGHLLRSTSTEGNEHHYRYDHFGRIDRAVQTIDGEEFAFDWQFDGFGRVTALSYPHEAPDGFWLVYDYDSVSNLKHIIHTGSLQMLWSAQERDHLDRVTLERFGNGLHTRTNFSETNGRTERIRTGTLNGSTLTNLVQDLAYAYYDNGNLYRRIIRESTTELDQYEYDDVNRLVRRSTAVPYVDAAGNITSIGPTEDSDLHYDRFGNISKHPILGAILSTPAGRVENIEGVSSHVYNAIGQLESTGTEDLTYTGLDKLEMLKAGGITYGHEYDAHGVRVKRTEQVGRSLAQTVYVGGLYDRSTSATGAVEHRYRVYAEGLVVAVGTLAGGSTNPNPTWTYLHSDRQGSTHVTTDENAAVVEKQLYDAWGSPRVSPLDPTFGIDGVPMGQLPHQAVNVGFTGHFAMQEGGLIDMGGRTYDPRLGRFTAPDPHMQFPLDTQNNAYSYVRNNPATYSDPTGYLSDGICTWCGWTGGASISLLAMAVNAIKNAVAQRRSAEQDIRASVRETAEEVAANRARRRAKAAARRRARREILSMNASTRFWEQAKALPKASATEPSLLWSYYDFTIGAPARFVTNGLEANGKAMMNGVMANLSDPLGMPGRALDEFEDTAAGAIISSGLMIESLMRGEFGEAASNYGDAAVGANLTAGSIVGASQFFKRPCKGAVCSGVDTCFVEGTEVHTSESAVAIEDLDVGDRVETRSGESETAVDDTWWVADITLVEDGRPDHVYDIQVLRPPSWFAGRGLGEDVRIVLDEMGVEGSGRINAMRPAPPIADGAGRVVLTTIGHANHDVFELGFREVDETLRPTGLHPIYSVDRAGWVRVHELEVGERLLTASGAVTLARIERLPGAHLVFNLEVESDHEFFVGELGVLAHNSGAATCSTTGYYKRWFRRRLSKFTAAGRLPKFRGKSVTYVERTLKERGFHPDVDTSSTWWHADGSQVRIDPPHVDGNPRYRGTHEWHVHKEIKEGQNTMKLDDSGYVMEDRARRHIILKQPADIDAPPRQPWSIDDL
ncbi:MAG: RHS repeat-associated core domain-containing protein [Deltaproteobacteria bacterium]